MGAGHRRGVGAVARELVGAASDALFGFFGRSAELERVHDARKQAHATQRCQAVFVAGEAGMGKTALVTQVARAAHAEGSVVLFGHADEDSSTAALPSPRRSTRPRQPR